MHNFRYTFLLVLFSLFSLGSFSQTISISDFHKTVKQGEDDFKLLRANQKGISIHLFGSLTGANSYNENLSGLNIAYWDEFVPKHTRKGLFTGFDIRIAYTKELFLPIGLYGGFGQANLFLAGATYEDGLRPEWSYNNPSQTWQGGMWTNLQNVIQPRKANYIVLGISKNLTPSSSLYIGYVHFITPEYSVDSNIIDTESTIYFHGYGGTWSEISSPTIHPFHYDHMENMGINIGYSYKLKNLVISFDNIIHFSSTKKDKKGVWTYDEAGNLVGFDSVDLNYHSYGPDFYNVITEPDGYEYVDPKEFKFGHRFQIGLGYLF